MRKLVRSDIPQIATVTAGRFETPTRNEYLGLLRRKLLEEVGEYLEVGNPEELPDIIEVCRALGETAGISRHALDTMCAHKTAARGDLQAPGVVWIVGE